MALKRNDNGSYVIKTKKEAAKALLLMGQLNSEIAELHKEHGIDEMMTDTVELKRAATRFMAEQKIDTLPLEEGKYARLITQGHNRRWILTDDESDLPKGVKPLRTLVRKALKKRKRMTQFPEIWKRVTKRVADPDGIDEVVAEGLLTMDEISAAFVEDAKAPFVRIYDSAPNDDD